MPVNDLNLKSTSFTDLNNSSEKSVNEKYYS